MNLNKFKSKLSKLLYNFFRKRFSFSKKIMTSQETLKFIIENKVSISRYGDGEFGIMRNKKIGFQKQDPKLARRLIEISKISHSNLLICVPSTLKSCSNYKEKPQHFWIRELGLKYWLWIWRFHKQKILGDTQCSRFYIDYKDGKINAEILIPLWREIWNNQDILIIEGENTRLGVNNNLFNNVKTIERIICPSRNAFDYYSEILSISKKILAHQKKLVIIALGPTATILAHDLSKFEIQALDIGHLDIEYEWYLRGAKDKVKIDNKSVNELGYNVLDSNDVNKEYADQIIYRVET